MSVTANVKDASTLANVPIDGVPVASAGPAISAGQAFRNTFAHGKSDGTATYADPDGAGNLQVNLKTSLPAGGNNIGTVNTVASGGTQAVSGSVTAHTVSTRITLNPTISTSAYVAGYCVGGLLTFANALGAATTGVLESIAIAITGTQTAGFKLYVFSSPPATAPVDHAAYSISTADAAKVIGVYTMPPADSGLGSNSTIYNLDGIGAQYDSTTTSLYAMLVTTGNPTFGALSLFVSVGMLQD